MKTELADSEWSFAAFEQFHGPVNTIFKCWYVFEVSLNGRFYINSNNFQNFKRKAAQFSGREMK